MLAHEVLRAAAEVIEKGGWSYGALARDAAGRPVALFGGTADDTGRASVNPNAVAFSLYGAICKATAEAGNRVERLPLMWDVLYRLAAATDTPHGGNNHLHPVMQFNEHEGRTVDEVLALLELAAQDCERIGTGLFPPPVGVTPEQIAAVLQ